MQTVSVVIPSYNSSKTLERGLGSIAAQNYPNVEVIIVDDCSVAEDVEAIKIIVAAYQHKFPVKLVLNDYKSNASATRNQGVALAVGELIAFLDADDFMLPNKLLKQAFAIAKSGLIYDDSYRSILVKS